jgi:hypothetical protein
MRQQRHEGPAVTLGDGWLVWNTDRALEIQDGGGKAFGCVDTREPEGGALRIARGGGRDTMKAANWKMRKAALGGRPPELQPAGLRGRTVGTYVPWSSCCRAVFSSVSRS